MDIVIKDATIVTADAKGRVLKDHSIAVEDGRIVEIGERVKGEADHVIDGRGRLVMPGFVNAHTHLSMTLLRGVADDLPLMTWLNDHIWPIEANLNEDHIRAGADLGIAEMIRSGTTCFNDMYWHMETVAESVKKSGIRAALSTPLLDVMGPDQRGKLLREGEALIKRLRGHERITPFLGPHAPYTCSEELLLAVKDLHDKYGVGVHIHVSETKEEVENLKKDKGMRPFEYLEGIGFLHPGVVAAHSVWVSEVEMGIMKERGVKVAHNPVSNMKIAAGVAPVPEYLRRGIAVGLGTDGAASNNSLDMFEDLKIAALLHKSATGNPEAVPAEAALEMATIGGARALGLDGEIGSIEVGKKADIIMVDRKKPHLTPLTNPVSHLVYAARGGDVSHTIVDGRILMEEGRLATLDEEKVMAEAVRQTEDLLAKSGTSDRLF
ncbi:MAG: N-ethylammeline chlorohydrolase [Methanobacteriota archaeon]|nr:MAG: N-ethylammeline chlorohydrolase [Euryarchaeota archaeon]